ncbi:uncharacterized protein LOC141927624 isoform X2 [Strix aluco]
MKLRENTEERQQSALKVKLLLSGLCDASDESSPAEMVAKSTDWLKNRSCSCQERKRTGAWRAALERKVSQAGSEAQPLSAGRTPQLLARGRCRSWCHSLAPGNTNPRTEAFLYLGKQPRTGSYQVTQPLRTRQMFYPSSTRPAHFIVLLLVTFPTKPLAEPVVPLFRTRG